MITLFHAIQSLVPGAEVSIGMYDNTIIWHKPEIAPVTTAQLLEEQQRLQQAYDWNTYQRNRAREYPSVQEQLDALYHAGVFPAAMAAKIRAVKEKYPRYSTGQTQTADTHIAEDTVTKLTVEQWLTQQSINTMTREEWLASQQQSTSTMTREEWLASQQQIETPRASMPLSNSRPTMTAEEWLAQQNSQSNPPKITREQWLEQQKNLQQPRRMTREEWLAEQAKIE